jgi:hypothetical protein
VGIFGSRGNTRRFAGQAANGIFKKICLKANILQIQHLFTGLMPPDSIHVFNLF